LDRLLQDSCKVTTDAHFRKDLPSNTYNKNFRWLARSSRTASKQNQNSVCDQGECLADKTAQEKRKSANRRKDNKTKAEKTKVNTGQENEKPRYKELNLQPVEKHAQIVEDQTSRKLTEARDVDQIMPGIKRALDLEVLERKKGAPLPLTEAEELADAGNNHTAAVDEVCEDADSRNGHAALLHEALPASNLTLVLCRQQPQAALLDASPMRTGSSTSHEPCPKVKLTCTAIPSTLSSWFPVLRHLCKVCNLKHSLLQASHPDRDGLLAGSPMSISPAAASAGTPIMPANRIMQQRTRCLSCLCPTPRGSQVLQQSTPESTARLTATPHLRHEIDSNSGRAEREPTQGQLQQPVRNRQIADAYKAALAAVNTPASISPSIEGGVAESAGQIAPCSGNSVSFICGRLVTDPTIQAGPSSDAARAGTKQGPTHQYTKAPCEALEVPVAYEQAMDIRRERQRHHLAGCASFL
jgi:hypothetical protein